MLFEAFKWGAALCHACKKYFRTNRSPYCGNRELQNSFVTGVFLAIQLRTRLGHIQFYNHVYLVANIE